VAGQPSSPRGLGRLVRVSGADLAASVEALLRTGVLASSVQAGELRLAFRTAADQEAVLKQIEPGERRTLHDRIGEELQSQGDDVGAAEHLLSGTGGLPAAEAAVRAGEQLEIAFAYERAIDLYDRALRHAEGHALEGALEERLCELLELTGAYDRAVGLAERLRSARPGAAHLTRRVGHLHLLRGDLPAARATLEQALAGLPEGRSARSERAQLLADLAEVQYLQGQHPEAEAAVAAVLAMTADQPVLTFRARNTLGKVHLERGDFEAAAGLFTQNLDESRRASVVPEETRALINLGITHLRRGQYEEAAECYRAGLEAAEASHDYRHRALALQNLGVLAHWRRDYASALELFHDAIQTFQKLGHRSWLSWLALDLGDLYLELGDPARAEAMLELSGRLVTARADSQTPLFTAMLRGKLAAFHGQSDDAETCLREAHEAARAAGKPDEAASAALELARVRLGQGNGAGAIALAEEFLDAPTLKTRAEAHLVLGEARLQEAEGGDAAVADLVTARTLFERVGDPAGLWQAQTLLAQALRRSAETPEVQDLERGARRLETRIRRSVPAELVDRYLAHPRRRALLESLGVSLPAPDRDPTPTPVPADPVEARPGPTTVAAPRRRAGRRTAEHATRYGRIIGEHEDLLRVFDLIDKVAPVDSTVLIRGESGTGKELIAAAIHAQSRRADRPFVKLNCGALVESLLLSELFGHERGAFTGAARRKLGRFEVADGGTLFLDEIGDITPKTQVALLRVLQEKVFERVGGSTPIRVDVRIVCATHRDLERMVQEGTFREDLYYRLKAFQLDLPPLRARLSDVPQLAQHFLERLAREEGSPRKTLSREAEATLMAWRWPGNIRELENVLRSVALLCDGAEIQRADLASFVPVTAGRAPLQPDPAPEPVVETPREIVTPRDPPAPGGEPASPEVTVYEALLREGVSLHELKKRIEEACISRALQDTSGNITRAAELLGMKRPRLSQLVKEYGLAS
jgi:DNA-binding NtrC family response regulator/tetratricopeptide (TPR) repeat protein